MRHFHDCADGRREHRRHCAFRSSIVDKPLVAMTWLTSLISLRVDIREGGGRNDL